MKQLLVLVLLASPFWASDRILDYVNHPENLQKTMEKNALESIGEMRMQELIQGILNQVGLGLSHSVVRKIQGYDVHEVKHENGTSEWILVFNDKGLVQGVQVLGATPAHIDASEIQKKLEDLPGFSTALVLNLETGEELFSYRADAKMSVASVFKLAILKALVEKGEKEPQILERVIRLEDRLRSFPGGMLQNWPDQSPVTIHTLASLMISISDNTATDQLLEFLGRENVEKSMRELGLRAGVWNVPLLSTKETFYLASLNSTEQQSWSTVFERRKRVEEIRDLRVEDIELKLDYGFDPSGWWFSARDVGKLLAWLQEKGDDPVGARVLEILAIQPGIGFSSQGWDYIGYKGGSQPGVFAMSFLLGNREKGARAIFVARNHAGEIVGGDRVMELVRELGAFAAQK